MKKTLCLTLLLVSIMAAIPAAAQTFGQPFPVTNTRYDTAYGKPRLSANGRDFFLFWGAERKIRATSLAQATPRVGHVVLDTSGEFDVAWTGEVFVAAATRSNNRIIGRVLDAGAQPLGAELALAADGRDPRLAAGPEAMVMVYRGTAFDTRLLVLGPRGESLGAASSKLPVDGVYNDYAIAGNESGFVIALSNQEELLILWLNRRGQPWLEYSLPRATSSYRAVELATDGDRYLLAWASQNELASVPLNGNGSFAGSPLVIRHEESGAPTPLWVGGGWSISYQTGLGAQTRARVAHLDRAARAIIAEEQSTVSGVKNPTFAAVGGRMMAAWNPSATSQDVSSVVELPLAANQPRVATYAATQQTLLATASSADATLMVWSEISESGESIRTGVRTHEGRWTEADLEVSGWEAVAASDGDQFAMIVTGSNSTKLFRLDGRGRPLGSPLTLPVANRTSAMAWNGTHYGIVSNMKAMLLSPTGALSAPVEIPHDDFEFSGRVVLASNGDGFLLVGDEVDCQFILCISTAFSAMRLDDRLQRIGASEIRLNDMGGYLAGVVWNGSEYVVAWDGGDGFHIARTAAAAGSPVTKTFTAANLYVKGIAPMPDGTIAIVGPTGSHITRVAFLRSNGSIAQLVDVESSAVASRSLLTTLPDGIAYVASSVQDGPPHHGTSHVMMAIARPSVPRPPNPPYVAAQLKDGAIVVDWSASAGTVNGFRLEYRVDDGSWNELEEWFPPGAHHRMIRPSSGTHFAIRMRAFNDGGASAYSETALTKPMRRRAAGH